MAYNFKNVTVLVVDDNHPMLSLLKAMLTKFGVGKIVVATNGEMGFKKFCREKPDIVISDWMMDPQDGVAFAKMIRTHPASHDPYVPFILMTGFSEEHRVVWARDVGITEFLLKPFSAIDLYKRLVTIIEAPRQFVKSEDFFGPDRRRRDSSNFQGTTKRKDDRVTSSDVRDAEKKISKVIEEQGVESADDVLLEDVVVSVDLVDRD